MSRSRGHVHSTLQHNDNGTHEPPHLDSILVPYFEPSIDILKWLSAMYVDLPSTWGTPRTVTNLLLTVSTLVTRRKGVQKRMTSCQAARPMFSKELDGGRVFSYPNGWCRLRIRVAVKHKYKCKYYLYLANGANSISSSSLSMIYYLPSYYVLTTCLHGRIISATRTRTSTTSQKLPHVPPRCKIR